MRVMMAVMPPVGVVTIAVPAMMRAVPMPVPVSVSAVCPDGRGQRERRNDQCAFE